MDTIDNNTVQAAAECVIKANLPIVHTVTIILNGATGGADVCIQGYESADDLTTEMTLWRTIR